MALDKHPKNAPKLNGNVRCSVFWTAVILVATLFPFDPVFSENRALFDFSPIGNPGDFLANILLFIPWGFFVAGMLTGGRFRSYRVLIILVSGLVLSVMVESLQLGLPSRDPALADILANLLGVVVGIWLEASRGERLRSWFRSMGLRVSRILTLRVLVGLVVLHMVLV